MQLYIYIELQIQMEKKKNTFNFFLKGKASVMTRLPKKKF